MQRTTSLNTLSKLLKGVGLEVLYPNFLALVAFTFILVGVSAWRFRKQLN